MFIFFDFDGLIADTEDQHMHAFDLAFQKLGIPAKSKPKEWVGAGSRGIALQVIEETKANVTVEEIQKTRKACFRSLLPEVKLMPHAKETIENLSKDFELGLVTSSGSEEIGVILEKFGLDRFFKVKAFAGMVKNLKPAPDLYLLAMEKAGVKEGVVLEDSANGVKAAKAAGLYCIAVPNHYTRHQDLSLADAKAENLKEAEKLIREKFF